MKNHVRLSSIRPNRDISKSNIVICLKTHVCAASYDKICVLTWTLTKQAQNKCAVAQTKVEVRSTLHTRTKTNICVRERKKCINRISKTDASRVSLQGYHTPRKDDKGVQDQPSDGETTLTNTGASRSGRRLRNIC